MTKSKKSKITLVIVLILLPCAVAYLNLRRPVVKTKEWTAVVTTADGYQKSVFVYKMWGFHDRLLVELPESLQARYHWFGIDSDGVSKLSGVGRFPYRHFNHDKTFGVLLDPANFVKVDDTWEIERNTNRVRFSNGDFEVLVSKETSH